MILPAPVVAVALREGGIGWAFFAYHLICAVGGLSLGGADQIGGLVLSRVRWAFCAGFALSVLSVAAVVLGWIPVDFLETVEEASRRLGLRRHAVAYVAAYFVVVNPVVEEWFWRGAVSRWFRRRMPGNSAGHRVPALLFGLWHAVPIGSMGPWWLMAAAVPVLFGLGWAAEVWRRRGMCILELALWHGLVVDLPVATVIATLVLV